MNRRSFLLKLCAGIGAGAVAAPVLVPPPANAMTPLFPDMELPARPTEIDPAVATPEDMEQIRVEKAWYGHWRRVNRRHWRRVHRRHYRRVGRRVYRRRYYYY